MYETQILDVTLISFDVCCTKAEVVRFVAEKEVTFTFNQNLFDLMKC